MDDQPKKKHADYRDYYFERGHWGLKIWETLVAIFMWILMFIPCVITGMTYWAYRTGGRHGFYFWHYREGFQELDFLMIFLAFALGMIAVFCLATGYIQDQRMRGLTDKWPLFDMEETRQNRQVAEKFMTDRFGDQHFRQNVRTYTVKEDQNLENNQLKHLVEEEGEKNGL